MPSRVRARGRTDTSTGSRRSRWSRPARCSSTGRSGRLRSSSLSASEGSGNRVNLAPPPGGESSVAAVVEGPAHEVEPFGSETGLPPDLVAIDETGATSKRLDIRWTPAALSVRGGDTLGTAAVVNDVYQVDSFVSDELAK